jgi:methylthioribose-1-phosphate isomerase
VDDRSDAGIDRACELLIATRPTAINLKWALDEMKRVGSRRRLPNARKSPARAAKSPRRMSRSTQIGRHGRR